MPRAARRRRAAGVGRRPASTGALAASKTGCERGREPGFDNSGIASAEQRKERMIHVRRVCRPVARVLPVDTVRVYVTSRRTSGDELAKGERFRDLERRRPPDGKKVRIAKIGRAPAVVGETRFRTDAGRQQSSLRLPAGRGLMPDKSVEMAGKARQQRLTRVSNTPRAGARRIVRL